MVGSSWDMLMTSPLAFRICISELLIWNQSFTSLSRSSRDFFTSSGRASGSVERFFSDTYWASSMASLFMESEKFLVKELSRALTKYTPISCIANRIRST
ncbi:hypothetical protein D3C76_1611300 [compost metagenome]